MQVSLYSGMVIAFPVSTSSNLNEEMCSVVYTYIYAGASYFDCVYVNGIACTVQADYSVYNNWKAFGDS